MYLNDLPHPYAIPGIPKELSQKIDMFIQKVNEKYNVDITQKTRKNRMIIDLKYAAITVVHNKYASNNPKSYAFPALSLSQIGEHFNIDHATVLYATRNNYHPEIKQFITEIEHLLL